MSRDSMAVPIGKSTLKVDRLVHRVGCGGGGEAESCGGKCCCLQSEMRILRTSSFICSFNCLVIQ